MKNTHVIVTALIGLAILVSNDVPAQWTLQNSGIANRLQSVFFVDNDIGFTVSVMGEVIRTTDGGNAWSAQVTPAPISDFTSVFFTSPTDGFIAGRDHAGACFAASGEMVLSTSDGGNNWYCDSLGFPAAGWLYSMHFPSPDTGYAIGDFKFYKTTDGGITWTDLSGITGRSIFFTDDSTGYVANAQQIYKTTDGGINWNSQITAAEWLNAVFFSSVNVGYAAGENGLILKTTDGGVNWLAQVSGTNSDLNSINFTDNDNGYAVGNGGTILQTTDGGANWAPDPSGTINDLFSVFFPGTATGYAVGDSGTVLKKTIPALPVAGFAASSDTICENDCINFTDASTNSPTSWMWYFPGGTPATSTAQNPTNICYASAGTYDVSLVATNAAGSDSIGFTNYITVEVCIGVKENTIANALSIYPNPTEGKFTISIPITIGRQGVIKKVEVFDLFGRKVLESKEPEIDMSDYPAGLYIWRVGEARGKVVIE